MRLLAVLTGALLSSASVSAAAQAVVRGKVTDLATGRPVAGATVTVGGTSIASGTNESGDYMLMNVSAGNHEIVVRRIGYARLAQQVAVSSGETRADFALRAAAATLDAVVVTGTAGDAEKRTLGNSITQIDASELVSKTTVTNVTEILQSKTPGVSILNGSGAPGTAGEIRIRGASSMAGYRPIILIDGIRYNSDSLGGFAATGGGTAGLAQSTQVTSALNNLNPNDIESIEVIKGPAAATLYGAEASNGVIQIITKRGARGAPSTSTNLRIESGRTDWSLLPPDNLKTCDATTQAATSVVNGVTVPTWPGCQNLPVNTVISDNPLVEFRDSTTHKSIRTGELLKYSGSVRGGGERYSFYVAGDRDIEQGVFLNSDNNRTSFRSNVGFNPNDRTDFQLNFNWQDGRLRLPIQDESVNGLLLNSTRGSPGRISRFSDPNVGGWVNQTPAQSNRYQNYQSARRLTMGGTVNFKPVSWFQNRLTAGFDNTVTQAQLLFLPGDIDASQDADAASGANFRSTPTRSVLTLDYAGTFLYNPRANITTQTRFGSQVVSDRSETVTARGIGIGAVDVTRVDLLTRTTAAEGYAENNSVGYYIQEQVGWNNRLFITAALRADDHSAFGTNFDMIIYPKLSASWVVSEEPAMQGMLQRAGISGLKLRSAWGQAGRAPTAYSAVQTYTIDRVTLGVNTGSALRTSAIGNPDLKPERGEEIELGFDLGMLRDRLGVDFTFYNKTTKDMLQSVLMPASTGFNSSRILNLGSILNRGFEISLFGTPVLKEMVSWDTRFNFSTNHNEVLSFGVLGKEIDTPTGQAYGTVQQHRVGYPLGGYWVTPPQVDADGVPILTTAGAAIFNPGDTARRYMGPSTPTREVGFSNTVRFARHFSAYALIDYKGGGFLYNAMERARCNTTNDNCEEVNDPAARFPGTTAADSVKYKEIQVLRATGANIAPYFIMPTDFIKLREVTVSMDLPTRLLARAGASSARLAITGRNLHTIWTRYGGIDPEVNSYGGRNFVRVDAYASPPMRRLAVSLNLTY